MVRDFDLIKKILEVAEVLQGPSADYTKIKGYSEDCVLYHIRLMVEANLIHDETIGFEIAGKSFFYGNYRLTWDGHEFLDNTHNESVWAEVKSSCKNMSFDVVKSVLSELTRKFVFGQIGIE